jgi:hypothetical protein
VGSGYRFKAPTSPPANLKLAGELIVRCDGTSRDGMTLEARYVVLLGRMFDVTPGGNNYYERVFDKTERTLTYVMTSYGIDASLEFDVNALVSNPLVHDLVRVRQSHLRKLTQDDSSPTEVRRGLDHAQGTELITHLAFLGVIHQKV